MVVGSATEARKTKSGWAEYMRQYRKARPEVMKRIDLKKNFGISLEAYQTLLEQQNYCCAVCKQPEKAMHPKNGKFGLAVDHDHQTGKIRGLLCMKCNRALGMLQDSPEVIQALLKYLGA